MTGTTDANNSVQQGDPRYAALQRLCASRTRLQVALIPQPRAQGASSAIGGENSDWARTARTLWRFVRSRDGAGLLQTVRSVMGHWWTGHPWRPTVSLLGDAVDAEVGPWVRKHPSSAIALGIGAGVAIAWIRPWRWSALHTQARSVRRSAAHWVVSELTSPAMQMLFATSMAAWLGQRNANRSAAPSPPGEPVRPASP